MKKKVLIVVGIIVLLILLFPVKYRVKDGGTIIYHAIAYEVIDWHAMMDAPDTPSNVNIYLEGV